jgi:lipid-A-disaccharide synthase-like uncharacterized protein
MKESFLALFEVSFTPLTIVGYFGALLFSLRWVVQVVYSYIYKKPVLPRVFWYISMAGSICLLIYFFFSSKDLVGVISNFFPLLVASFNLVLDIKNKNKSTGPL